MKNKWHQAHGHERQADVRVPEMLLPRNPLQFRAPVDIIKDDPDEKRVISWQLNSAMFC